MSVLIKGIHIPTGCAVCFYNRDTRCLLLPGLGCDESNGAQRRENCPIIELPDHGDLVDRDVLIDVLYHGSKNISEIQRGVKDEKTISYCQGIMVGYATSRIALVGAPVVIPAERSEDE